MSKSTPTKKRIRTDVYEMFDGDCLLYRTPKSGRIYQFQMWVRENQKYVRKSTRTRNLDTAISVGKEIYLDTNSKLRHKEPVFYKTFKDVVEEYLKDKRGLVGVNITFERWKIIRCYTRRLLEFVGDKTNLVEISNDRWMDYFSHRKNDYPDMVNGTLVNEMVVIKNFYKFCILKRYLPPTYTPEFPRIQRRSRRREHFSEQEWETIWRFMKTNEWLKNPNPKICDERKFIRDFVVILINTGLRPRECRLMKWENIIRVAESSKNGRSGKPNVSVQIHLHDYQTKNREERTVIGRRGDVFNRVKEYSKFTKPTDYIFVDNATGKPITKPRYYDNWRFLIKSIGFDKTRRDNSFYCFRHSYCSWRLLSGLNILTLSKNMGTSISQIQKHYEHITMRSV